MGRIPTQSGSHIYMSKEWVLYREWIPHTHTHTQTVSPTQGCLTHGVDPTYRAGPIHRTTHDPQQTRGHKTNSPAGRKNIGFCGPFASRSLRFHRTVGPTLAAQAAHLLLQIDKFEAQYTLCPVNLDLRVLRTEADNLAPHAHVNAWFLRTIQQQWGLE